MRPIPVNHPELKNGLTDHQPMVLSALNELGASAEQQARYRQQMARKTQPLDEPATAIPDDTVLQGWLGRHDNYPGLYQYFYQQCQRLGVETVVRRYVPGLAEGLTSRAFHPLIRLGHAVHDHNEEEVAAALAYWAWAYQPLPFPEQDKPADRPPLEVLTTLLDGIDWPKKRLGGGGLISDEFVAVTRHRAYQQLRFRLSPAALDFDSLRSIVIHAYWMHDDFTLLHSVTGLLAAERISTMLNRTDALLEHFWKGVVLAWLSKGLRWKSIDWPRTQPERSLAELRYLAGNSSNDHTVKLVAACLDHYQRSLDVLFLHAAQRAVEKDPQLQSLLHQSVIHSRPA